MSDLTNSEYFARRATVARVLAETATDARAAEAHLGMALRYRALAEDFERRRPVRHKPTMQSDRVPAWSA